MKKKNAKRPGTPPVPETAGRRLDGLNSPEDWIEERQAAHLAAFQEIRRMEPGELAALLVSLAEESADRAGDFTCHDEAMPELMREAACILAAEIVRKKGGAK